ncbi:MAG TPA: hypothetical protein VHA06_11330 [Candidatus Angelobacter sp.]|nr:hypothetical protein [Candidatus Angelobacter sp.]
MRIVRINIFFMASFPCVPVADFSLQNHIASLVIIDWFHIQKKSVVTLACGAHPEVVNLAGFGDKAGKSDRGISF